MVEILTVEGVVADEAHSKISRSRASFSAIASSSESRSFRGLDRLPFALKKNFADALAWSASITVHRTAVPCETPGAWQLPLLFGALPSWERALEKGVVKPLVDHLQLRKKKKKKRSPSLACHGSTQNYPLTVKYRKFHPG
jgi:hypothetical protein